VPKINAINNKSAELTIDPGASGDSFVQFDINGTGEFRVGVDDSDSDKFKISAGSALGTGDTFIMTANGERTMPLQPCFLAHRNGDIFNITGDGTVYSMVWDSEEKDQGGDFNGTTTFTAPITGQYRFICQVQLTQMSTSNTSAYIEFVASGDTYRSDITNIGREIFINNAPLEIETIIPMTASDTISVRFVVNGGTKVVDVQGNNGAGRSISYFSGFLIC